MVAITGASGSIYGIRLLELLHERGEVETHLVISPAGRRTLVHETDYSAAAVEELADSVYGYRDIGAPLASGSFATLGTSARARSARCRRLPTRRRTTSSRGPGTSR